MLGWIATASAVGAAVVVGRWWLRRVDPLGRLRPKPWFSAGALLVLTVVAGGFAVRHHAREAKLSSVASALVGHPVRVHCEGYAASFVSAEAEPGYVRWQEDGLPEPRTTVKADQCATLAAYVASSKHGPTDAQVVAVHLLTHESMHMAGRLDEAAAECAAVQRDAETARLLGAAPTDAVALARTYWTAVYPRMREEYRTADCADGARLDEGLPDAPWGR